MKKVINPALARMVLQCVEVLKDNKEKATPEIIKSLVCEKYGGKKEQAANNVSLILQKALKMGLVRKYGPNYRPVKLNVNTKKIGKSCCYPGYRYKGRRGRSRSKNRHSRRRRSKSSKRSKSRRRSRSRRSRSRRRR